MEKKKGEEQKLIEELVAVVRAYEWSGEKQKMTSGFHAICTLCRGRKEGGHHKGCPARAVLDKAEAMGK